MPTRSKRSTLNPVLWVFRWLLLLPPLAIIATILYIYGAPYHTSILSLFIRPTAGQAWMFDSVIYRILLGGPVFPLLAWAISLVINALANLIPLVGFLIVYIILFLFSFGGLAFSIEGAMGTFDSWAAAVAPIYAAQPFILA